MRSTLSSQEGNELRNTTEEHDIFNTITSVNDGKYEEGKEHKNHFIPFVNI